ncbi:MAG: type IV pilus twitching motility protein PilT [Candidatus Omnitrophica bacterium]|nr:type IV pilus twitching motility protein PilT [Candidatus Omnitrophota bacterium]
MEIIEVLKEGIEKGCSDIHIAVGRPPMFRVAGKLTAREGESLTPADTKKLIYAMLTETQTQAFETNMELDCSYTLEGGGRFRVNVYIDRLGISAALRLIPSKIPTPQDIDLPPVAMSFTEMRNGLVLVTGPTGSGKSTTLAAMLNTINTKRNCHIMTVEDPIEFIYNHEMSLVNQREVEAQTKTFAAALKHFLRQDPDVILIGEMRDLETISAAITMAETGHLVFATLHTLDAPQTVDRIIDVFPPYQQQQIRTMLSTALRGVVCQQLIPKKDGRGRVAAREIMLVTPAISNNIKEGKTHQIYNAMQTGGALGMVTMEASVKVLLAKGLISQEAAKAALS